MNWNYLIGIIPLIFLVAQFYGIYDWLVKRDFPTVGKKLMYMFLLALPPVAGLIIYYYNVVFKKRYVRTSYQAVSN